MSSQSDSSEESDSFELVEEEETTGPKEGLPEISDAVVFKKLRNEEHEEQKASYEKPLRPAIKISKSIHVLSDEFRELLRLASPGNSLKFDEQAIDYETYCNVAIQKVAAKNGVIRWDMFLEKLKHKDKMFDDWDVTDLRIYIADRPFLFKDYDRYYGVANIEFHQYLLVQAIAKILFNTYEEKMEFDSLLRQLSYTGLEVFRHRAAAEISDGLHTILVANRKYFKIVQKNGEEDYCDELEGIVYLKEEAKDMVSLWHECAIDIVRGIKEAQNEDFSRTSMVFGRVEVSENQYCIKVRVLKYYSLLDPKKTYVFIDKQTVNPHENNFEDVKPGKLIVCETYRIGLLSSQCNFMAKSYRLLHKNDQLYMDSPYRVFKVLDESNNVIEEEVKKEEHEKDKEGELLLTLKFYIDRSFEHVDVISAADIVVIMASYNFKPETVIEFITNQCHLYEITEDQQSFKPRTAEQVEKLTELVKVLVKNRDLPSEQINLGISESEFNELWPIISGKFETKVIDEKCCFFKEFSNSRISGYNFRAKAYFQVAMGQVKSKVNVDVVQEHVKNVPVVMYTKTACNFCTKAKDLFNGVKIGYTEVNLDTLKIEQPKDYLGIVNGLVYTTRQTSVPQIFICGKFIGGYNELSNLQTSGKLLETLAECTGENRIKEEP